MLDKVNMIQIGQLYRDKHDGYLNLIISLDMYLGFDSDDEYVVISGIYFGPTWQEDYIDPNGDWELIS